jgi:hypothetical protein
MLIRLIAVVAGFLVFLLVIRYTLAADYTECDRKPTAVWAGTFFTVPGAQWGSCS